MRNRNGQGCSCARRIEQDQRFHLVRNLFQNAHVASASGLNNGREGRFAQARGWTGCNRLFPWLCGVLHAHKNRVARGFIPGSLLTVSSDKRNRHTFLAVWPETRSTPRPEQRCTEVTIQNYRYRISEDEGSIRNCCQ